MTTPRRIIVQASPRSWSGAQDLCMRLSQNKPVVQRTVERAREAWPQAEVVVAAPAFARGELDFLAKAAAVTNYYGHDASPLSRMLDACKDLVDTDLVLRIDGLHLLFDPDSAKTLLRQAEREGLDCAKFPDDFPVQFTSDAYRVGALRRLEPLLENGSPFRVHPKYFMFSKKDLFRCAYLSSLPSYTDAHLRACRKGAETIYDAATPRLEVNDKRIAAGDQLSFHYELALRYLSAGMKVLDVACGEGHGTRVLARALGSVHGADLDPGAVAVARQSGGTAIYHVEDVTHMSFADSSFDAIVSMETIEHVDAQAYLREIARVLKKGGTFIVSTPQNSVGHIPVNACHLREYSLKQMTDLCAGPFSVTTTIGIKAGRIVIDGDPIGANTVLVCRKP